MTTPPREHALESAIAVASLAHACAKNQKERREAWDRLMALKAKQREQNKDG